MRSRLLPSDFFTEFFKFKLLFDSSWIFAQVIGIIWSNWKINGIESKAINLPTRACLFFTQKAGDDEEDANYFDNQGRTLFCAIVSFLSQFFNVCFFILIHTLALVTIFLNNLYCICIFLFQFVFFIYPVLCHVYLCFCVIVSLCICVSVLTSPWWGCRPSRVYSGRKYRRTELIICPVLCK